MTSALETPRLARTALPIVAILVFGVVVGAIVAVAGDTLGFDFLAYHQAATRVLDGRPAYDLGFEASGGFGLFYYPPTFVPLILPFGLLSATTAVWAWTALLIGAFLVGVVVMPVSTTVSWWIVLLAGLSWPFTYARQARPGGAAAVPVLRGRLAMAGRPAPPRTECRARVRRSSSNPGSSSSGRS